MVNNEMLALVSYIERERGVDREIVLVAVEQAIQQAARHNPTVTNDLHVVIDRKTLEIHVFDTLVATDTDTGVGFISMARAKKLNPDITDGGTVEVEISASRLGRIVAQTSRQLIMQKIRDAERSQTFIDFKSRVGEIVSGTVSGYGQQHHDLYVMVGKTEMMLPGNECISSESYQLGDSIRAVVKDVGSNKTGPAVTLSRTSPEFLRALFRLEVSEIGDGIVEIMGVSRDPGFRAKLAVRTRDDKVDPVGACVGLKGSRVREIVRELNGEKIDIVRWSADVKKYVESALQPAHLESIEVEPDDPNTVFVKASPEEYKKAIGRRGQNVRLAMKLTGLHIDVKKTQELVSFEDQKAEAIKQLADLFSIPTVTATQIADSGYLTVEGILANDEEYFVATSGIDEVTARGVYAAAKMFAELTKGGADNE